MTRTNQPMNTDDAVVLRVGYWNASGRGYDASYGAITVQTAVDAEHYGLDTNWPDYQHDGAMRGLTVEMSYGADAPDAISTTVSMGSTINKEQAMNAARIHSAIESAQEGMFVSGFPMDTLTIPQIVRMVAECLNVSRVSVPDNEDAPNSRQTMALEYAMAGIARHIRYDLQQYRIEHDARTAETAYSNGYSAAQSERESALTVDEWVDAQRATELLAD